jgi:hypothetical protein
VSQAGGRFETFDANERFVVVRDDEGYGVWRFEDLADGNPLERFSDDDAGYEAAVARWEQLSRADRRSRSPWMSWLKIAVIASAAISVVSSVIFTVAQVGTDAFSAFRPGEWMFWLGIISQTAFQVTVALVAIYIVVWLDQRGRDQ